MSYVSIRIDSEAAEMLNKRAAELGKTKSQVIIDSLNDDLLEQLDAQSEEIPMEEVDVSDWVAGVAPACCCDFYSERFNPKYKCEHWKKVRWQSRDGKTRLNWYNSLIGKFDFADEWKTAMQEYM